MAATENSNIAKADLTSATKADTDAKTARSTADSAFKLGNYKKDEFTGQEKTRTTAVSDQDSTLDSKLKAFDNDVEKTHILNRKTRDLNAATDAKASADADLAAN